MSDRGPLVPELTPNPENTSKMDRTTSPSLLMKKDHANLGDNWMKNGAATATSVKHKCYKDSGKKFDTMAYVSILCGNCTCMVTFLRVYWKLFILCGN